VIVPAASAAEATLVPGIHVRNARSLGELLACLKSEAPWPEPPDPIADADDSADGDEPLDLADVHGLANARHRSRPPRPAVITVLVGHPASADHAARRLPHHADARARRRSKSRIHSASGRSTVSTLQTRRSAPHHRVECRARRQWEPRVRPGG
jgi:hypothetical protein